MNSLTTHNIRISIRSTYQPVHSKPAEALFVHSYEVLIENLGDVVVQLLSRHWIIQDSNSDERHVEGDGVVGQQPILAPGESHQYTSWCPLKTDMGKMHGTYIMKALETQREFVVRVPEFNLIAPFKFN